MKRANPDYSERLVIFHVDDHRDLGSPRLLMRDDRFVDMITGAAVSVWQPDSVLGSIESGALGMGSFLTPFLHQLPHVEVRHLCQPPKVRGTTRYTFRATTEPDSLLAPSKLRPAIALDASLRLGQGTYQITCDKDEWSDGVRGASALLHIDMDYFNNRYDGDSDWLAKSDRLDPPIEHIFGEIQDMVTALRQSGAVIEDTVIALSPGFFPSEFWEPCLGHLQKALLEVL